MPVTYALQPHPAMPPRLPLTVTVAVACQANGDWELTYHLRGDLEQVRVPRPTTSGPADGLWQHTCCEAFVGGPGDAYREFNFSPSGQWAIYDFFDYRQRLATALPAGTPRIAAAIEPDELLVMVILPATLMPSDAGPLGLTVVVEETDGGRSYWALGHTVPQPDFHRRESFLAALPA